MKTILFFLAIVFSFTILGQQFGWSDSGYTFGGGFYTNIDGKGTDVIISGFINETTFNGTGCMKTGVNNQQSDSIQHVYQLNFSKPIDLWFEFSELNSSTNGSCYNDVLTFSGSPIFTDTSDVSINGNIVTPNGPYPKDGKLTVFYKNVQNITIVHGDGEFCNPGEVYICALNFGSLQTEPIFYPNVITPNFDGINDLFKPIDNDIPEGSNITIFNRWGNKIGELNEQSTDIDNNNIWINLNDGVYYYEVKSKHSAPIHGFVQVIKE